MEQSIEAITEEIINSILKNPKNLATQIELVEQSRVALNLFKEKDFDKNNTLSIDELKFICEEVGLPMERDEEEALMKIDDDDDGAIDIQEWLTWWLRRSSCLPNPVKQQEAIATNIFKKFDKDNSGALDLSEFENLLNTLGAHLSESEMEEALKEIDEDENKTIELSEFLGWWTHRAAKNRQNTSIISLKMKKLATKAAQIFFTDIFTACWNGDIDQVNTFIISDKKAVKAIDINQYGGGWTPLHYACYKGHRDIVELLINAGAGINEVNEEGFTSLFYAGQQGHVDICSLLIDKGADPTLYGTNSEVEDQFMSPVEFINDYPKLKQLFINSGKCSPPIKIDTKIISSITLSRSTGLLSVKFNGLMQYKQDYQKKISSLPLLSWDIILIINSKAIVENNNELKILFPSKNPIKSQDFETTVDKNWLKLLQSSPAGTIVSMTIAGINPLYKGPPSDSIPVTINLPKQGSVTPRTIPSSPRIDISSTTLNNNNNNNNNNKDQVSTSIRTTTPRRSGNYNNNNSSAPNTNTSMNGSVKSRASNDEKLMKSSNDQRSKK